jgi:hypothetical protein
MGLPFSFPGLGASLPPDLSKEPDVAGEHCEDDDADDDLEQHADFLDSSSG